MYILSSKQHLLKICGKTGAGGLHRGLEVASFSEMNGVLSVLATEV